MANMSTANGTCCIIASSQNECYKLYDILKHAEFEKWEYATIYASKIAGFEAVLLDGRYQFQVDFEGYGRWSYFNNIEASFRWLKKYLTEEEWMFLTETDFEIRYEYTDYECGFQFLEDDDVRIIHCAGLDPTYSPVIEESCESYPYSPLWLMLKANCGRSIDEVLDGEYFWDELDEENKKRLYERTVLDYKDYYYLTQDEAKERVLNESVYFKECE